MRLESFGRRELVDGPGDGSLEGVAGCDVDDSAAARAQEVVVVLGEVLGQLEAGELVVGRDASDHPGDLEVDEVAVGGAAG